MRLNFIWVGQYLTYLPCQTPANMIKKSQVSAGSTNLQ